MSVTGTASAALALRRFGLGPRPGERGLTASDPQGALLAQLARSDAALLNGPDLLPSSAAYLKNRQAEEQRRIDRAKVAAAPGTPAAADPAVEGPLFNAEARARFVRLA